MTTRPALRTSAAPSRTVIRSSAPGRRSPDSADRLERLSDRLDALIRDVRLGATAQREHDRHVDEAEAIAAGIRAIFRQPTPPRPVHPPLGRELGGTWW